MTNKFIVRCEGDAERVAKAFLEMVLDGTKADVTVEMPNMGWTDIFLDIVEDTFKGHVDPDAPKNITIEFSYVDNSSFQDIIDEWKDEQREFQQRIENMSDEELSEFLNEILDDLEDEDDEEGDD